MQPDDFYIQYNGLNHKPFYFTYMASDGTVFKTEFEARYHEMMVCEPIKREKYYQYLMAKRNWFQRLFNIKPDMSFYDEMTFKSRFK